MIKGIFITATGTDVGKTYVTALLVKALRDNGLNAGYYKAALSGADRINNLLIPGDARHVCDVAGLASAPASLVSYIYATAVAPHLAARLEGNPLELDVVRRDFAGIARQFDYVVAEGSGGIVCPLRSDATGDIFLTDVIKTLALPVIVVSDAGLGAINGCVLTVEYAQKRGIVVTGIILNRYEIGNFLHEDNKVQIERITQKPVVACIAENAAALDLTADQLARIF